MWYNWQSVNYYNTLKGSDYTILYKCITCTQVFNILHNVISRDVYIQSNAAIHIYPCLKSWQCKG